MGSNPTGAEMSVVNVVCCQLEVSATGRSLVQRSPTDCGVSECDRGSSKMTHPRSDWGCELMTKRSSLQQDSIMNCLSVFCLLPSSLLDVLSCL